MVNILCRLSETSFAVLVFFFFCLNFSRCSQNSILAIPHFFLPVRKWTTVSLLPAMVSSTELLMCFCMRYSRMPDAGCCYCCCYYYCYCWHADLLTQFVSVPLAFVILCSRPTIQKLIWPQATYYQQCQSKKHFWDMLRNNKGVELFHQPTLMHNFYLLTICLLHYYPRHVSSINMPIFRRKNFIHTASGIFALCKRLLSTLVESGGCVAEGQVFKPLTEHSSQRNNTRLFELNSLHSESG